MTDSEHSAPRRRGPARGTPRAPRLPRADREAQIIDVAEKIFSVHGYSGTTMEAVADAAGITKPVIYNLFASKDGLLAAVMHKARLELVADLQNAWQQTDPASGFAGMHRAGLVTFFRFMDTNAAAWYAVCEHQADGYAPGPLATEREVRTRTIGEMLRSHPEVDKLSPVLIEGYTEALIGTCERVALWRQRRPECTPEIAADLVTAVTWTGMERILAPSMGTRARGSSRPPRLAKGKAPLTRVG